MTSQEWDSSPISTLPIFLRQIPALMHHAHALWLRGDPSEPPRGAWVVLLLFFCWGFFFSSVVVGFFFWGVVWWVFFCGLCLGPHDSHPPILNRVSGSERNSPARHGRRRHLVGLLFFSWMCEQSSFLPFPEAAPMPALPRRKPGTPAVGPFTSNC